MYIHKKAFEVDFCSSRFLQKLLHTEGAWDSIVTSRHRYDPEDFYE